MSPSGQEIKKQFFDCGSLATRRGEVHKAIEAYAFIVSKQREF